MKNMLIIAAAAAALLIPLTATGQPHAGAWGRSDARAYARYEVADRRDEGRGGGHGEGRGEGRYGGGQGRYGGGGPGRYEGAPRYGGPGRYEGAGQGRYGGPAGRYDGYEPPARSGPRAAAPAYGAEPPRGGRSWRQGQYLPPAYRGAVVRDPGRYRLRPPPPGYDWVGVGSDIYLMQRGTGMVLDTIPGGY